MTTVLSLIPSSTLLTLLFVASGAALVLAIACTLLVVRVIAELRSAAENMVALSERIARETDETRTLITNTYRHRRIIKAADDSRALMDSIGGIRE